MNIDTFAKRVDSGKSNYFIYSSDGKDGMISIWKNMDLYILTLEECFPGCQYDESSYTRDERLEFSSLEQMFDYLVNRGIDPTYFTP
jgi:hypothetical protein